MSYEVYMKESAIARLLQRRELQAMVMQRPDMAHFAETSRSAIAMIDREIAAIMPGIPQMPQAAPVVQPEPMLYQATAVRVVGRATEPPKVTRRPKWLGNF